VLLPPLKLQKPQTMGAVEGDVPEISRVERLALPQEVPGGAVEAPPPGAVLEVRRAPSCRQGEVIDDFE
jgi:hypothetical protein